MQYQPFRTAMVRAALFPITYQALTLGDDPETGLRAALADNTFLEALWLASPSLAADAELLAGKPEELSAKRRRATVTALTRYVLRAGTRATPFGAFAGVAPATWAAELACAIGPSDAHHRVARLDHGAAMRMARTAEQDSSTRDRSRVLANPALYTLSGRLILPYRVPDDGAGAIGEQVSLRLSGPLVHAIRTARHPIGYVELRDALVAAYQRTDPERITEFLDTLLDQEVLISTWRPPLTPDDPALALADLPTAAELTAAIEDYGTRPLGHGADALRAVYAVAGDTGRGKAQRQVQVDVLLDAAPTLPRELVAELDSALFVLARLGPQPPPLSRGYRDEFIERYGNERVPLLELLDPYAGLGAPAGYRNPPSTRDDAPAARSGGVREEFLASVLHDALRAGSTEIRLDPTAVADAIAAPRLPPAESVDVFVQLGREADGDWFAVLGPGSIASTPAGRAFGRFSHLDPRLAEVVAEVAELEQANHPERAFAGLSYAHSRGHVNNVGIVAPVHEWQLAIGTTAGVPAARQLRLADLEVFPHNDRLALTATGLDRELVLRAPNLLNPSQAPNAARLALSLGMAPTSPTEWSWGELATFPFLPRVRVGRVVLAPARWRLPRVERLDAWLADSGVPRHVHAGAYDNRLLLDLHAPNHLALLRQEIARGVEFVTEALPALDAAPATGPTGRHVLEAVVPLRLVEPVPTAAARPPAPRGRGVRLVLPGEDWTYAKLYGPPNLRTQTLRTLHAALAGHDWFFVRYADPLPHLRIRVRGSAALRTLLDTLRTCVVDGRIGHYSLEGYQRELERYGGEAGLAVAERIFCADTRVLLSEPAAEPEDVVAAVTGIEQFLAGLGFDVAARREVYQRLATGYAREHAGDDTVSPARLARLFQQHQRPLRALLREPPDPPRAELGPPGAALRALALPDPLDVLCSLTHMHANRRGLTRVAEFRAVDLLRRAHHDVERLLIGHVD